jgi:pimeloyl-ACP methyl ester carboxylesterase
MTAADPQAAVVGAELFTVDVPESTLADLQRRLRDARLAADYGNDAWRYGVDGTYLTGLVEYWADGFDWRAQESAMNRYEQHRLEIDGIPIHFLRARGVGPDPVPIVLSHGWPMTFWDYREMIGPLSDPAAHGGDAADAFDVIVPSLPGFAFSSPLRSTGVGVVRTADLWVRLMVDVLGYQMFGAHGADWGDIISLQLGHKYPERIVAVHVTRPAHLRVMAGDRPWSTQMLTGNEGLDEDQRRNMLDFERAVATHVAVHVLDPQTLAYALNDSPVGLCAWILERLRAWADCDGDVETRFSMDDILTKMTLFWVTETIGSSMRFYADTAAYPWTPSHDRTPVVEAPTGVTVFHRDVTLAGHTDVPRGYYNLTFERHRYSGGHFAPAEEPAALVEDIRDTFRPLR